MSDIIKTDAPPSLEERFKLFNRLIDAALRKYHPDTYKGDKPQVAEGMTRKLTIAKDRARKIYKELKP